MAKHYRFRYSFVVLTSYRRRLREFAHDNHGYVTTADAATLGVPAVELPKLAARGGLEHIGYGLYRIPDIPPTDDDQFAEAALRAGSSGHLRGDSVLALLGLADVNPRTITVGTTRRTRRAMPSYVTLVNAPPHSTITRYRGIRCQVVSEALLECRGRVPNSQLRDAAAKARAEGLLTTAEWKLLSRELTT